MIDDSSIEDGRNVILNEANPKLPSVYCLQMWALPASLHFILVLFCTGLPASL